MPLLSEFFGIKIYVYWDDHLPPHFHAEYNGEETLIDINKNCVLKGMLPANKLKLVLGWAEMHHDDLIACWEATKNHDMPHKIEPLK